MQVLEALQREVAQVRDAQGPPLGGSLCERAALVVAPPRHQVRSVEVSIREVEHDLQLQRGTAGLGGGAAASRPACFEFRRKVQVRGQVHGGAVQQVGAIEAPDQISLQVAALYGFGRCTGEQLPKERGCRWREAFVERLWGDRQTECSGCLGELFEAGVVVGEPGEGEALGEERAGELTLSLDEPGTSSQLVSRIGEDPLQGRTQAWYVSHGKAARFCRTDAHTYCPTGNCRAVFPLSTEVYCRLT